MPFSEKTPQELAKQYASDLEVGISQQHVEELQKKYGKNVLQAENHTPWHTILLSQFKGMLIYILLVAAIISALLGEPVEAIIIGAILVINGVFGFVQELKAQASIESLKELARSNARVIRDGKEQDIPAQELVPGDILLLETGDKVPADARIISQTNLQAAEGALTGESVPVQKTQETIKGHLQLGDQKNMVFSGTVITKGRAQAIVVATAMKSEIGKIAHMIQDAETEITPLQKQLDKLSGQLGKVVILICVAIFAFILIAQRDFSIEALKDPFLTSVGLAVAAIPEGLPIVVTIALAFGTQRMVKKNALIKKLSSVETLGSTTVICSDKTGTLTRNEMTVTHVYYNGKDHQVTGSGYEPQGEIEGNLPDIFSEIAILCNDAQLNNEEDTWTVHGDPTEGCLLTLARKDGFNEDELAQKHPRIAEIPFDSERKRMSTVHQLGDIHHLLTKGAPDIILNHCTQILDENGVRDITEEDKKTILTQNEAYATQALRVLGFAYKHTEQKDNYDEHDESNLIFVGLAGMIDPAREEAKGAVAKCQKAGIRVVMITGDHQTTASAIAKELGITGKTITGEQIHKINLEEEVESIGVFARVNPEDKMLIVDALKKHGHIVAMTGDGVNDAPALKKSDIGIAMGITGTDVAKESASMILTDDNFTSIVNAVEEGRNIYTNIKKFVNYLLSSNLAEVLTMFLAIFLFVHEGSIALPLTVTMILYMNLLTDSLPALALGVDPGDKDAMSKQPRDPKETIVNNNMFANIILIGIIVAAATLFMFNYSLQTTGVLAHAQTLALTTLVVLEIIRLAMIRSQYNTPTFSNKWLIAAVLTVFALQALVIYAPFMQVLFGTVALTLTDFALLTGVSIGTYAVGMLAGKVIIRVTGQQD